MKNVLFHPNIQHDLPVEANLFFRNESSHYTLTGSDDILADMNSTEIMAQVIEGISGLKGCIQLHEGNYVRLVLHDQARDIIVNRHPEGFEFDCYSPDE